VVLPLLKLSPTVTAQVPGRIILACKNMQNLALASRARGLLHEDPAFALLANAISHRNGRISSLAKATSHRNIAFASLG